MLDLVALRSLCSVAEHGTLAKAAIELGFTPSAVSQQIARLERHLNVRLLAPAGRGVLLTPTARQLVDHAPEVFAALERCEVGARAQATGEPVGTVRVASFSTAIRGLLAPALANLTSSAPRVRVDSQELDPVPALRAVEIGGADLALVHDADGVLPDIAASLIARPMHIDTGDLILPRDHPLAQRGAPVTRAEMSGLRWVSSPPGTVCHRWFQRLLSEVGESTDVRHCIDDFSTQVALVAADGVAALLPRLARPPLPRSVTEIPLASPPRRTVHAVWRASSADDPALGAVVDALVEVC